jgi:hypothetical protein
MSASGAWLDVMLATLSGLAICCFLARFNQQVHELLQAIYTIIAGPVQIVDDQVSRFLRNFRGWIKTQIADECRHHGDSPLGLIITALICTSIGAVCILCDWDLMGMTNQALGMDDGQHLQGPIPLKNLPAGALIGAVLFFGFIASALLGVHSFGPWKQLKPKARIGLLVLSLVMICLALFLAVIGGEYRSQALMQATDAGSQDGMSAMSLNNAIAATPTGGGALLGAGLPMDSVLNEPGVETGSDWILRLNLMGIPLLSGVTLLVAGFGLILMMKLVLLLFLALLGLAVSVVKVPIWFLRMMITGSLIVVQACLGLACAVGQALLRFLPQRFLAETDQDTNPAIAQNNRGQAADVNGAPRLPEENRQRPRPSAVPPGRRSAPPRTEPVVPDTAAAHSTPLAPTNAELDRQTTDSLQLMASAEELDQDQNDEIQEEIRFNPFGRRTT